MAAVLFAAVTFRHQRSEHDREQTVLAATARANAERVEVTALVEVYAGENVQVVLVQVRNRSHDTPLFDLTGAHPELGPTSKRDTLTAGDKADTRYKFDPELPGSSLSMPQSEHRTYAEAVAGATEIEFTMNDRRWRRIGGQPPIEI